MSVQPLRDKTSCACGSKDSTPSATLEPDNRPWGRREIADLSNEQIESMSDDALFNLIRASEHPWDDRKTEGHLIFADRRTLLQLAYLVRNCCRNAECAAHEQSRRDELDGSLNRRDAGTLFGNPR
jgi:hypothetical protein